MKNSLLILAVSLSIGSLLASEALALRGGGRGGGGGISRGGGGGMSGASVNRSPSMSRPATPSVNRAAAPSTMNRAAAGGARPTTQSITGRTGGAGTQRASSMSAQQATRSPQSFNKPSQQQIGNFLNMPQGSAASKSGASQRSATTSSGGPKTYTTKGGSTITLGGKSGSGVTEGGAQVGGAAGAIKVETAGGQTYGKVGAVGGATDGTNSAVRGGSITGAQDAQGNKAVNVRGGYADSSGYRQGGSVTAAQNKYGYTAVAGRGGYGYGNGTGQVGGAAAVRGPAGNVVSGGRGGSFVNGQFVGGQSWSAVNGSYTRWNTFGPGYATTYPNCWWPGKWAIATTAWATATYAVAGSYCGCSSEGTYYDYGENVTYDDGTVYQDGEPVATAEEYYQQADQIADSGQEAKNEEWMPLGVFAVISEGQTNTDKVVQLALNKEGVIRGNFQDLLADSVTPVTGAVDTETQRVALKLTGNDSLVVETGLYNLTNDEVPVLLHFGADRQESRTFIRLEKPADIPE